MGRVYSNSVLIVLQAVAAAKWAGLDIEDLCRTVGIDSRLFQNLDNRIPVASHQRLLAEVARRTGNEFFWVRQVRPEESSVNNISWYTFFNSATLGDGQERGERIYPILSDVIFPTSNVVDNEYCVQVGVRYSDFVPSIYQVDWLLSGWWCLSQMLAGSALKLKAVRLAVDQENRVKPYKAFFEAPVFTGGKRSELVFDLSARDLPNISKDIDPNLNEMLTRFAEEKIARLPTEPTIRENVHAVLQHQLLHGAPSLKQVAMRLGMSPRSLQRRLMDEGLTYSMMVQDSRKSLASSYLKQPGLNITEVALMLGFSDINSLTVAFRKWYGMTPTEFRRQQA